MTRGKDVVFGDFARAAGPDADKAPLQQIRECRAVKGKSELLVYSAALPTSCSGTTD